METTKRVKITVEATINAPIAKVWELWTMPEHICNWCFASADWQAPWAKNDLRKGGKFTTRMEAKDGSFGFEFGGVYDEVKQNSFISYTMDDSRTAEIIFKSIGSATEVVETFEAESENPVEMQKDGWQAILNNFKAYVEK